MTTQQTQIVTDPSLMPFPFTFMQVIQGQGAQITVTFPSDPSEVATLLTQAATQNPAQIAAWRAAQQGA